jgi:hypothetical protein
MTKIIANKRGFVNNQTIFYRGVKNIKEQKT